MLTPQRILLASHGTPGATAADATALALAGPEAVVFHLTVVPDFWKGMMGDDWLNNVSTRIAFASHLESELGNEIRRHRERLSAALDAKGIRHQDAVMQGDPAKCLLEYAVKVQADLVVIGSPRPKGVQGLRSRMHMETLLRGLAAPLLVAAYPR